MRLKKFLSAKCPVCSRSRHLKLCKQQSTLDVRIGEVQFSDENSQPVEFITGWSCVSTNYCVIWNEIGHCMAESTDEIQLQRRSETVIIWIWTKRTILLAYSIRGNFCGPLVHNMFNVFARGYQHLWFKSCGVWGNEVSVSVECKIVNVVGISYSLVQIFLPCRM